jgi:hypothetical protein
MGYIVVETDGGNFVQNVEGSDIFQYVGGRTDGITADSTDTLTNKTIAAGSNTISGLTHGSEVDNPTSGVHGVTGSVVGTSDTQTLTGKTIAAGSNTISGLVGTSDTQTLTGKTIAAGSNTISGLTHGSEVDNPASGVHGVTGSVVGTSDAQTLTNKTLGGVKYSVTSGETIATATYVLPAAAMFVDFTTSSATWSTMTGSSDGRVAVLQNQTGADVTIVNNSGADGFITGTGDDLTWSDDVTLMVTYVASASRWYIVGGVGGGANLDVVSVTADVNPMVTGFTYQVDTGTAARTMTLPSGTDQAVIWVADKDENAAANNITIARNGSTISGLAEDFIIDLDGGWAKLTRADGSSDWTLELPGVVGDASSILSENNTWTGTNDFQAVTGTSLSDGTASLSSGSFTGLAQSTGTAMRFSKQDATPTGTAAVDVFDDLVLGSDTTANTGMTIFGTAQTGISFGDAAGALQGQIRYQHATDKLEIYTNSAEAMVIDSSGNVGIGTSSPSYALSVKSSGDNANYIVLENGENTNPLITLAEESGVGTLDVRDATGATKGRLKASGNSFILGGNFGIGAPSPGTKLDVLVDSGTTFAGRFTNSVNTDGNSFGVLISAGAGASDYPLRIRNHDETSDFLFVRGDGNVGIGTANPGATLHVNGSDTVMGQVQSSASSSRIRFTDSSGSIDVGSSFGQFKSDGIYNINLPGGSPAVHVSTDGFLGTNVSIRAAKANIQDISSVSWLTSLRPVTYNFRDKVDGQYTDDYEDYVSMGLIAEEVEPVKPELCFYTKEGDLAGVDYTKLIVPLLKAIQELTTRLEALEAN